MTKGSQFSTEVVRIRLVEDAHPENTHFAACMLPINTNLLLGIWAPLDIKLMPNNKCVL